MRRRRRSSSTWGRHRQDPQYAPFVILAGANVLVADEDVGEIESFPTSGGTGAAVISGLTNPAGMAISGSTLYVVNNSDSATVGSVGEYTLSGTPINASFITGLAYPDDVAVMGNNLFVLNYVANTVSEYNATTGALIGNGGR